MSVINGNNLDPYRGSDDLNLDGFKELLLKETEEYRSFDDESKVNKIMTRDNDFKRQAYIIKEKQNLEGFVQQAAKITTIEAVQFLSWKNANPNIIIVAKNYKLPDGAFSKENSDHVKYYLITSIWKDALMDKLNVYIEKNDYSVLKKINLYELSEAFVRLANTYRKVFFENVKVLTVKGHVFCDLKEKYNAIAKDLVDFLVGTIPGKDSVLTDIIKSESSDENDEGSRCVHVPSSMFGSLNSFDEESLQNPAGNILNKKVERFANEWLKRSDSFRRPSRPPRRGSGIKDRLNNS